MYNPSSSKPFKVVITETLKLTVKIEAEDPCEAEQIASVRWRNSEYILDSENFVGVDFEAASIEDDEKLVRYESAYSPQSYVEAVTGQCYLFQTNSIAEMIAEIQYYLDINGYYLQSYPLPALQPVIESKLDVVLVELAGETDCGEWETVYRWFEVSKGFPPE